jgi:putative peptidoglycan lipid II flippase
MSHQAEAAVPASRTDRDAAIGRSTATISGFTLLSRISGFFRIVMVTAILGTTALGDIYESANLVPNLLFELFAAGSVQAVLVPALVSADERHGESDGDSLANGVLGWLLATLGAVAVVALVGAPLVMRLLTAGEPDPSVRSAKAELGSRFLAIFIIQLLFYAVGLVATALLQARRRFAAPAIAPLFNNLVVIGAYLLFAVLRQGAPPSLSLTSIEIVVFTSVPAIALVRSGVRWRPRLRRDPEISRLARQGAWAGAYLGLTQLLTLGVVVLGNGVDGAVARFTFAFTFFQLPYALLAIPVATARFPAMASAVISDDRGRLSRLVGDGVVTTVAGCAAASAAMLALAWPLVRLTAFGHAAGAAVGPLAHAVAAFAPGLVGYGLFYLLTRVRYAQGDARSPTLANALVAVTGLAAMIVGVGWVADDDRAAALAAAYGGAHLVGAIVLGVITERSLERDPSSRVTRGIVASLLVSALAGIVMALVASAFSGTTRTEALVSLVAAGVAGLAVLFVVLPPATGRSRRVLLGATSG